MNALFCFHIIYETLVFRNEMLVFRYFACYCFSRSYYKVFYR